MYRFVNWIFFRRGLNRVLPQTWYLFTYSISVGSSQSDPASKYELAVKDTGSSLCK